MRIRRRAGAPSALDNLDLHAMGDERTVEVLLKVASNRHEARYHRLESTRERDSDLYSLLHDFPPPYLLRSDANSANNRAVSR
jgi:hypothetical protein